MNWAYFDLSENNQSPGTQSVYADEKRNLGRHTLYIEGDELVLSDRSTSEIKRFKVGQEVKISIEGGAIRTLKFLTSDRDYHFWANQNFLNGLYRSWTPVEQADVVEIYHFSGLQWIDREEVQIEARESLRERYSDLPAQWSGKPWASGTPDSGRWSLIRSIERPSGPSIEEEQSLAKKWLRPLALLFLLLMPITYLMYMGEQLPDPDEEKPALEERFVKLRKPQKRMGSLRSTKGAGARRAGAEGKRSQAQKAKSPGPSKKVDVSTMGLLSVFRSDSSAKVASVGTGTKVGGIRQASGILKSGTSGPGVKDNRGYGTKGSGAGGGGTSLAGVGLSDRGQGLAESGTGTGFVDSNGTSAVGLPGEESLMMDGGLDPSQIQVVIRRHLSRIRACYEAVLQTQPGLAGKVRMAFTILGSGRVASPQVIESSLGSPKVHSCVSKIFSKMQFPQPVGGVKVPVRYPFSFQATR